MRKPHSKRGGNPRTGAKTPLVGEIARDQAREPAQPRWPRKGSYLDRVDARIAGMRMIFPLLVAGTLAGCRATTGAPSAPAEPVSASGLRHVVVEVDKLE